MTDVNNVKKGVDILIDQIGDKIWINIDGICILRINDLKGKIIAIEDRRKYEQIKTN